MRELEAAVGASARQLGSSNPLVEGARRELLRLRNCERRARRDGVVAPLVEAISQAVQSADIVALEESLAAAAICEEMGRPHPGVTRGRQVLSKSCHHKPSCRPL